MRRIFVAVKERSGGSGAINPILEWFVLECGHLASRHISVLPHPKKMYCQKCSRARAADSIEAEGYHGTPMALFWKKIEAGKLWKVYDMHGKLLGFVRWGFDGWDGYVVTGNKWPNGDRCVTLRHNSRLFWPIRYAVENALYEDNAPIVVDPTNCRIVGGRS